MQITRILVRWAPQATAPAAFSRARTSSRSTRRRSRPIRRGPRVRVALPHRRPRGPRHDAQLVVVKDWVAGHRLQGAGTSSPSATRTTGSATALTSVAGQTPNTLFKDWDKVNNEKSTGGGQWTAAGAVRRPRPSPLQRRALPAQVGVPAQTGQTPPSNLSLWTALPNTACGQLAQFCQGNSMPSRRSAWPPGRLATRRPASARSTAVLAERRTWV